MIIFIAQGTNFYPPVNSLENIWVEPHKPTENTVITFNHAAASTFRILILNYDAHIDGDPIRYAEQAASPAPCAREAHCPTWDEWDGIFLPWDDSDVRLHRGGDNALEDRNIASHGFLVLHTDCIGLP